jgi:hypothetical protein
LQENEALIIQTDLNKLAEHKQYKDKQLIETAL